MPAQKRALETTTSSPVPSPKEEKPDDSLQDSDNQNQQQTDEDSDSDDSSSDSGGEKDEIIVVKLAEIRKEVQCPICLGIIRKTRTVMECLHRFCRECIDKSMRLGNNECPACRTHCASRRSLRDDPNFDALIAVLYTDLDKYEEEELAFHEEEKARNKQIQASISQTFRRQAEALGKKRTSARVTAAFTRRQGTFRNLRGRRNHQAAENQESDEEEGANGNDGSKDSSSGDDRSSELKSKRYKRWGRAQISSGAKSDGVCDDNDSENGDIEITEIPAWGRGGMRSNKRHGGLSWVNGRISRTKRNSRLIDHLQCSKDNEEVKINLTLVSVNEEKIPNLKRPYLCCSSKSTIRHICQFVGMQTSMEAGEVEILIKSDFHAVNDSSAAPCGNELVPLKEHQTLGEIYGTVNLQNLVFAYQQKTPGLGNILNVETAAGCQKVEAVDHVPKVEAVDLGPKVETVDHGPKVEPAGNMPITEPTEDGTKTESTGDGQKTEAIEI